MKCQRFAERIGDVQRTAAYPRTRCRTWERFNAMRAAAVERVTLAEFIRAAVTERARRILRRAPQS